MSAVASPEKTHAVAAPVEHVLAAVAPAAHESEAAEQRRWMTWFGLPALIAAFFVGLVFGTGQEWYLGLAVASIVADIGVLIWLAMSSDTNSPSVVPATAQH
jgi:hypothetical protein